MFNRPILLVGGLMAAMVLPYLALNERVSSAARAGWNSLSGKAQEEERQLLTGALNPAASHPLVTSPPPPTIEEVFRFDLTPQWVAGRWPRVSTVLGEPKQLGMRVALVSGTRPDDIVGSLTYYFDQHHQLQRITFNGFTGDPRRLLANIVVPYSLKSQPTTNVARYTAGDPQQPTSEVVIQHVPLVDVRDESMRAEVSVDLRRGDAMNGRGRFPSEPEIKLLPSGYRRW